MGRIAIWSFRRLPSRRGVEQAQQFQLLFCRQERRFERVACQLAQMLLGESKSVLGKLVFASQRRAEQRRIIGVERDHESLIKVIFHRMVCGGFANSSSQITSY